MAKSAHRTPKAKSQKPKRSARTRVTRSHGTLDAGPTPTPDVLAGSPLEGHLEAFAQWLEGVAREEGDDADLDERLPAITTALVLASVVAQAQGLPADLARWRPPDLSAFLQFAAADGAAQGLPVESLTAGLNLFFAFLGSTDRWPGEAADLATLQLVLESELEPDGDVGRLVRSVQAATDVDLAEQDSTVAAMPLVADLVALLVAVRTRREDELAGRVSETDGPALEEAVEAVTAGQDDPMAVQLLWTLAVNRELVQVDGLAATLSTTGAALVADPGGQLDQTTAYVLAWLALVLAAPQTLTPDPDVTAALGDRAGRLLGVVLTRGLTPAPMAVDEVAEAAAVLAAEVDEHREDVVNALLRAVSRTARAGFLDVAGDRYVVHPGLQSLVAQVLEVAAAQLVSGSGPSPR